MLEDITGSASQPIPQVVDQATTIETLRKENAQLRAQLAKSQAFNETDGKNDRWQNAMAQGIGYSDGQSTTSSVSPHRLL